MLRFTSAVGGVPPTPLRCSVSRPVAETHSAPFVRSVQTVGDKSVLDARCARGPRALRSSAPKRRCAHLPPAALLAAWSVREACDCPAIGDRQNGRHSSEKISHTVWIASMPTNPKPPLGFNAASSVLELGRAAFFGGQDIDLPQSRSDVVALDDSLPQFGYVGSGYGGARVLLLGINPGNGPNDRRSKGDEVAIPALHRFCQDRTESAFLSSQRAYRDVCESWPMWRRHCSAVIGAGRLSMDEIAYSNCVPWRTASEARLQDSVAERSAKLYAYPLIDELEPRVIIALGKRAAAVLCLGGRKLQNLIVWNRAQAATPPVLKERDTAAAEIMRKIGRVQCEPDRLA